MLCLFILRCRHFMVMMKIFPMKSKQSIVMKKIKNDQVEIRISSYLELIDFSKSIQFSSIDYRFQLSGEMKPIKYLVHQL